jgi:hypothetical protein
LNNVWDQQLMASLASMVSMKFAVGGMLLDVDQSLWEFHCSNGWYPSIGGLLCNCLGIRDYLVCKILYPRISQCFLFNFVMLLKWQSSGRIFSQILWHSKKIKVEKS